MRERLLALAERRARLAARAQDERATVNALLARTDGAASLASLLVSSMRGALDQAGRHPLVVVAGIALLAALRPRRALTWLAKGWSLWRLYHGAHAWWLRFVPATATAGAPAGTAPKSA
jgi:hypothetical protein